MSVRIIFEPRTPQDSPTDEVLAADETVQFDGPWLHVVKVEESVGGVEYTAARSYTAHGVTAVIWSSNTNRKERPMSDAQKTAIDTLVSIAKNEEATPADETRIRAACAILDRLDKVGQEIGATA